MGRTLINEKEKKRILGMHKSYGYTISEQGESIKQIMSSDSMNYDSFNKPGKPTEAEDDKLRSELYNAMIGVGGKFVEWLTSNNEYNYLSPPVKQIVKYKDDPERPKWIQEVLNFYWNDPILDNFFKDNGFKSGYSDSTFEKDATDYISRYNQLKANPSLWVLKKVNK